MTGKKIIRTICVFSASLDAAVYEKLTTLAQRLDAAGYVVQTRRVCTAHKDMAQVEKTLDQREVLLSIGTLNEAQARRQLQHFYAAENVSFNIDLTPVDLTIHHTEILFDIIKHQPEKTFNFTYVFHNPPSSPYFPAANYHQDGFAIGLQPTDLAAGCQSLDEWLQTMQAAWEDLARLFRHDSDFLGIDASIAPLFTGHSSFIHFIKRLGYSFGHSVLTDIYLTITTHLTQHNPHPVGLCGLMFPCLEDFELAAEYDRGEFSVERNLFLALHSGLGIDTYPIGIDESPEAVLHILRLLQGLGRKYGKPLSARFVSDGQARCGEKTRFRNPYLQNVTIRPLLA